MIFDMKRTNCFSVGMGGSLSFRGRASGSERIGCFFSLLLSVALLQGAARAEAESWILVDTKTRTLSVFRGETLLRRFDNVAFGRNGYAEDRVRGDGRTPLGTFEINRIHRSSRFLRFFGIDYPRPEHAQRAFAAGLIDAEDYARIVWAFSQNLAPPQDTPLGGQLGIHGVGRGDPRIHEVFDWTQGCIALSDRQVERLSKWIHLGMRVEVR